MNAAAAAAPAPAPAPAPAALSAGCTSGWAGDGAGPAQKEAGRAHPGPRNPCLLGAPPADCGGRGAPAKGDPAKAPHATAPPREQARSSWCGPAPCQARGGRATWGRIPSAPIGAQRDCPAHRLQRIPPRSASAGYCYNPGFPGATGMGRGSKHWSLPSSTTLRNAPPSVSRPLTFSNLLCNSQTKRGSNSPLSSLCPEPV